MPLLDENGNEITEVDDNQHESNAMKSAREAAERNGAKVGEVTTERDQLAIENAAIRALGLDVADRPLTKMFLGQYAGEPTPDAIKAAAIAVGIIDAPTLTPAEQNAQALQTERIGLADGALPPLTDAERQQQAEDQRSPQERGLATAFEEIRSGIPRDQAATAFFGTMIDAAVNKDSRALVHYSPEVQQVIGA